MKRPHVPASLPAMVAMGLGFIATASAQTDSFTYQGRLERNGAPFTGTANLQLRVMDALTAGRALSTVSGAYQVANGQFTVTFSSVPATVFNGDPRWVEIGVDDPDVAGTSYVPLTPRQPVTAAPYAMRANLAGSAATLSGTIAASQITGNLPASQLSGPINPSTLGTGTTTGTMTFSPASGAPFAVGSTTKVTSLNADLLDGLDSSAFLLKTGGTATGSLAAPFFVGSSSDSSQPAIQGYHTATTGSGAGLFGQASSTAGFGVYGIGATNGYGSKFLCNGASGWAVYGASDLGLAGRFEGRVSITGATTLDSTLNITGATTLNSTLNIDGATTVNNPVTSTGGLAGFITKNRDDASKQWVTYARNGGGVDQLAFYSSAAGFDVASLSPAGDLYLIGSLSTTVLTIRGGADVAEPFPMTKPAETGELDPGSVVVIDEEHPGKLKLSTEACDTRVAGIISGAGGVKPGLRLHQEGVMEGDQHVALSGRVYVKADTVNGAIKPGDLLTTSGTPGHATRVTDHLKAQGAVLGKAMSSLNEGDGLVLVLVTLQ